MTGRFRSRSEHTFETGEPKLRLLFGTAAEHGGDHAVGGVDGVLGNTGVGHGIHSSAWNAEW